jgi:hypothetical protein
LACAHARLRRWDSTTTTTFVGNTGWSYKVGNRGEVTRVKLKGDKARVRRRGLRTLTFQAARSTCQLILLVRVSRARRTQPDNVARPATISSVCLSQGVESLFRNAAVSGNAAKSAYAIARFTRWGFDLRDHAATITNPSAKIVSIQWSA